MGKPNWKFRLLVVFVVTAIVLLGLSFSGVGHQMAKDYIVKKFEELPPEERRDSYLADWWMTLAWWASFVRGDTTEGKDMYRDFCGYKTDAQGRDFTQTLKLVGMCSEDGKTGWGPVHKRAPEAFVMYLDMVEVEKSSQMHDLEMFNFYRMFYTWAQGYGPERKIHPCFKKYWDALMLRHTTRRIEFPPDVNKGGAGAPASPEDC